MTTVDRADIDSALDRLQRAWAARDADAVAAAFAVDGVYAPSVGSGAPAIGRSAIHDLATLMFANNRGESEVTDRIPLPDGAFWTWQIVQPNGAFVYGCDRVRVQNGLVVLKDAYRKLLE